MTYWLMSDCKDQDEWEKVRAQVEMPPPNYTGTLTGTVWDPAAMAAEYAGEGY